MKKSYKNLLLILPAVLASSTLVSMGPQLVLDSVSDSFDFLTQAVPNSQRVLKQPFKTSNQLNASKLSKRTVEAETEAEFASSATNIINLRLDFTPNHSQSAQRKLSQRIMYAKVDKAIAITNSLKAKTVFKDATANNELNELQVEKENLLNFNAVELGESKTIEIKIEKPVSLAWSSFKLKDNDYSKYSESYIAETNIKFDRISTIASATEKSSTINNQSTNLGSFIAQKVY